jgi:ATP-dependent DNA helicase RecG
LTLTQALNRAALPNWNYAKISMPNGVNGGIETGIEAGIENNAEKILKEIHTHPQITQEQLSIKTNLSIRTVARELKNLRNTGAIRRVGSDRSGYWAIAEL